MIILDTNVLSELMRAAPEPQVIDWVDRQPADSIWITSITEFEGRLGLALLPPGKRRQSLQASFEKLLREDIQNRILVFDSDAAAASATVAARRQKAGRLIDMRDTQIAGIALSRRATLATRNVRHFDDLKLNIVNPWS